MGSPERGFYSDMTIEFKRDSYQMTNEMRGVRTGNRGVQSVGRWRLNGDVVELVSSSPPRRGEPDAQVRLKATLDVPGPRITVLTDVNPGGATFTRQPLPQAGPLLDPSAPLPATRPATRTPRLVVTPPPGWDAVPAQMPNLVAAYVRADDPKNQAIAVHAYSPPPARTLRDWAEMNASRMRFNSEGTRTLSSQAVPVAGGEGWSLVLEAPGTDGGSSRVVQLLAIKAAQGVSVTLTVPKERQDEATQLAQDLMASIQPRP
jgi:hypothetical protein